MGRWALALLTTLTPTLSAAGDLRPEPVQSFRGRVLPLAKVLEKQGVKADAAQGMALVGDDGKLYTLVKDDIARLLFLDKELHDRSMQLTGRLLPGSQVLHVTGVHSLVDGKPHEIFYWCEKCQLRATEPGPCKCCGGPTERLERPVK